MSADLEFRPIRLPTIRITPPRLAEKSGDDCTAAIRTPKSDRDGDNDGGEFFCRTPTSRRHKIPAILSCPPAPRKARRMLSCKRKLFEVDFFEIVGREEIEAFFRSGVNSGSGSGSDPAVKRKCSCP